MVAPAANRPGITILFSFRTCAFSSVTIPPIVYVIPGIVGIAIKGAVLILYGIMFCDRGINSSLVLLASIASLYFATQFKNSFTGTPIASASSSRVSDLKTVPPASSNKGFAGIRAERPALSQMDASQIIKNGGSELLFASALVR